MRLQETDTRDSRLRGVQRGQQPASRATGGLAATWEVAYIRARRGCARDKFLMSEESASTSPSPPPYTDAEAASHRALIGELRDRLTAALDERDRAAADADSSPYYSPLNHAWPLAACALIRLYGSTVSMALQSAMASGLIPGPPPPPLPTHGGWSKDAGVSRQVW
jgi:hypothetical protein